MGSTNISIGIDGRSSSRILKPPGGAHTDIFGASEINNSNVMKCSKQMPKSSISECFEYKTSPAKTIIDNDITAKSNGNENEPINTVEKEVPKSMEKSAKIRVPPGGFSSGLCYLS
ncbi:hypothetical protein FQA39_LY07129 [Lamprigera yunnana]|nr:hypothetical protein FQA39_LY07129 [Lamprigera yunnana]